MLCGGLPVFLGEGFPLVGKEFFDFSVGVCGDADEEIAEVGVGVESVAFGALDQAVEGGGGVSAELAACEKPVFSSDAERAYGAFGGVILGK